MGAFDYDTPAELYSGSSTRFRQKALKYRRFERVAEAIRYVMEDIPPNALLGCSIEVAEETYIGKAIQPLYDSPDFPLPKRIRNI
ncbi:MAG: hypothetical protein WAK03_12765 [Methylocystis sp.]|jgi:hypothetical protein